MAGSEITASPAHFTGGGLPVCYDPLLRSVTNIYPSLGPGYLNPQLFSNYGISGGLNLKPKEGELRFGAGIVHTGAGVVSFVNGDPQGGAASAHGLQRITNFLPFTMGSVGGNVIGSYLFPFNYPTAAFPGVRDIAGDIFASPEDVVFHESSQGTYLLVNPVSGATATNGIPPNSTTPELNALGKISNDWKFTWFFTGRQTDITNGTVFDGDIVVCDSRPFAVESLHSVFANSNAPVASGEFVMEAIFGYSATVFPSPVGYSVGADQTILVRWPPGVADPEIKVGSWVADVTYERNVAVSLARTSNAVGLNVAAANANIGFNVPVYPLQRCHWYQVGKRTQAEDETAGSSSPPVAAGWRRMVLYVNSPLKAKTLLRGGVGPINLNVALFMPSVVNVFPRTVTSRNSK